MVKNVLYSKNWNSNWNKSSPNIFMAMIDGLILAFPNFKRFIFFFTKDLFNQVKLIASK